MPDNEPGAEDIAKLEPPVSGSAGTQLVPTAGTPSSGSSVAPLAGPFDQSRLGAVLTDFVDVRSAAVSAIAVAAFHDAQDRVKALAAEIEALRAKHERSRDDLQRERETRLVLEASVRELRRTSWIERGLLLVGGVAGGTGVPLLVQGNWVSGVGFSVAGLLFIVFGLWLGNRKVGQ